MPSEAKPLARSLDSNKVRSYRSVLDLERQHRAEPKRVWPSGGDDPVRRSLDPRNDRRVIRAQRKLHPHRNLAAQALDDPHQTRRAVAPPRHEVDHAHRALGCLEIALEHERPRPVATRARMHIAGRREAPAPMPLITQQSRKARRRIEARETQPVHRSITTDQSSSLHVTNQAIVLNTHETPSPSCLKGQ